MPLRRMHALTRVGSAVVLLLALAACTPGGQFDPTEVLSSDMFGTKKKLQGDREPLFPNGVPGAQTGVPPDLVKGYQAPPEQSADNSAAAAKVAAAPAKPKPKPKPRPKIARAPPAAHDPAFDQKPMTATQQAPQSAQTAWPAPPSNAAQSGQTAWPAPAQAAPAQPNQSVWPAPPAPGTFSH